VLSPLAHSCRTANDQSSGTADLCVEAFSLPLAKKSDSLITRDNVALYAAFITASTTSLIAVLTITSGYFSEKRLRRRTLYGEAYKAAMSWIELVSRVRRRRADSESGANLIDRFHDAQEEIFFHRGWIGSESIFMQRSFDGLVKEIKRQSRPMIQQAWEAEPLANPAASLADLTTPDLTLDAARFLRDVRNHLSPLQFPKLTVAWRNRKASTQR
jgi:hypothetical protein